MAGMSERPVAIVTGGSAGIGAIICRHLIDAGYDVVSLARRKPDWSHPALHAIDVDLSDAQVTEEAAASVARQFAVSTLVHNAGVIRPNLLADVRQQDLAELTQLHLGAAILLMQAVLPGMRERKFGRVVLISSRAALGLPTRTAYSATKAGMIGMARTWALELAPSGITVNVVAPGPIGDTEMFREVVPTGDAREAAIAKSIPVGRLGTSDDVARAVMFFAAPESSFITGQLLYVCGGASVASFSL
jgi:NAD(P)-dependent dehydrogenase (short-subunit alcohol dehydrogenase family)